MRITRFLQVSMMRHNQNFPRGVSFREIVCGFLSAFFRHAFASRLADVFHCIVRQFEGFLCSIGSLRYDCFATLVEFRNSPFGGLKGVLADLPTSTAVSSAPFPVVRATTSVPSCKPSQPWFLSLQHRR
jgi:hypothetical protein